MEPTIAACFGTGIEGCACCEPRTWLAAPAESPLSFQKYHGRGQIGSGLAAARGSDERTYLEGLWEFLAGLWSPEN